MTLSRDSHAVRQGRELTRGFRSPVSSGVTQREDVKVSHSGRTVRRRRSSEFRKVGLSGETILTSRHTDFNTGRSVRTPSRRNKSGSRNIIEGKEKIDEIIQGGGIRTLGKNYRSSQERKRKFSKGRLRVVEKENSRLQVKDINKKISAGKEHCVREKRHISTKDPRLERFRVALETYLSKEKRNALLTKGEVSEGGRNRKKKTRGRGFHTKDSVPRSQRDVEKGGAP